MYIHLSIVGKTNSGSKEPFLGEKKEIKKKRKGRKKKEREREKAGEALAARERERERETKEQDIPPHGPFR